MSRSFRDKLIGPGDSVPKFLRRAVSVGVRTGLVRQIGLRGLLRMARLITEHPVGPGIIHSLYAADYPDRAAVVTPERTLTYAELDTKLNQFVHGLRGLGIHRSEKLVIVSPNGWQYLVAFFGAIRGGFSAVHASYRLTADELEYIVTHADTRALIFAPDCWPAVGEVRRRLEHRDIAWIATEAVEAAPDVPTLESVLQGQPRTFPPGESREEGAHNVVYTSGTTGRPKGAVRNMSDQGIAEALGILERMTYRAGERHLVVCPLYHSGAQAFAALHGGGGSTLVVAHSFEPEQTLRLLHSERIDSVFLVPTMIRRILDLPPAILRRWRPSLSCLISGAASFPHPLRLRAIEYFGPVIHDFYGTTENGWLTLVGTEEMLARPNTVGRAIAGAELLILDNEGAPLPAGEVGRVTAHSGMVIEGYHADAAATAESRVGAAQISGDLGYLDEEGYLYLSGRSTDMIITGGVNAYPAEVEQVLVTHPLVQDVAVLGLPDELWGEAVAAFVVGPGPEDIPQLKAFCRARLAGYKVPRVWHFLAELPRNPTGKVLKRELRRQYATTA
ncbi:MAG: AMP-binding protein [bacterium]